MKIREYYLGILVVALSFNGYSQNGVRNSVERNTVVQYQTRGRLLTFLSPKPLVKGSVYLHEGWKNIGVIEFDDSQKALTKNINYNVDTNGFEALFGKDSIHQYNLESIKSITLNNKRYQQYDYKDKKSVFEIIYEGANFSILKSYKIHVYKASTNPMVNITRDQYTKREQYFVRKGNSIEKLTFNKKNILKIFKSNGIAESDVKNYVKTKALSYKNEFDVQMLLKHYL